MKNKQECRLAKGDMPLANNESFKSIVFGHSDDSAEGLLTNAMAVTRFLAEISTVINYRENALSDDAASGLYLILTGLEGTLFAVAERM